MARTTRRYQCGERNNGCTEQAFYDFDTQRDAREYDIRYSREPWRCTRHSKPAEVISADNATRATVLTAERSKRFPDLRGLFWREDGHDDVGSGLVTGPGFKAWADDFPNGTRLVVTAALELPEASATAATRTRLPPRGQPQMSDTTEGIERALVAQAAVRESRVDGDAEGPHGALNDPAAVIRMVAGIRAVVALHTRHSWERLGVTYAAMECPGCDHVADPCPTLQALAAMFAPAAEGDAGVGS